MTHRVLKSYRSNIYVIDIYAIMKTIMKKMLSFPSAWVATNPLWWQTGVEHIVFIIIDNK